MWSETVRNKHTVEAKQIDDRRRQCGRVVSVSDTVRWSRVLVLLLSLAGFVHGHPEFKSSATLVANSISQLF